MDYLQVSLTATPAIISHPSFLRRNVVSMSAKLGSDFHPYHGRSGI